MTVRGTLALAAIASLVTLAGAQARPSDTSRLWAGEWMMYASADAKEPADRRITLVRRGLIVTGDGPDLFLEGRVVGPEERLEGRIDIRGVGSATFRIAFAPPDFDLARGPLFGAGGRRIGGLFASGRRYVRTALLSHEWSKKQVNPGGSVDLTVRVARPAPYAIGDQAAVLEATFPSGTSLRVIRKNVGNCSEETSGGSIVIRCVLRGLWSERSSRIRYRIEGTPRTPGATYRVRMTVADAKPDDAFLVRRTPAVASLKITGKPPAQPLHLAGTWEGQEGALYTIVHARGAKGVRWAGQSADGGKFWTHDFSGTIVDGTYLVGRFEDRAPGSLRNSGDLVLKIHSSSSMSYVAEHKDTKSFATFSTRAWRKCPASGC